LERGGDPAKLAVKQSQLETAIGDRLLPDTDEIPLTAFYPKAPDQLVEGKIIDVLGGVTEIGQYQTVVLNRGTDDGLEPGDVLQVLQGGYRERDRVSGGSYLRPLEEAGILMVYWTYPRLSFGLVMYANRALHVLDTVRSPNL
jgi:hypothetical protein